MSERGIPYNEAAYAMGKMLNHGEWQNGERVLPRKITASDVDMVFDNAGAMLFCEISRHFENWLDLPDKGQRWMYENLIKGNKNCCVLGKHEVDWQSNKLINTRVDIKSFQPMVCVNGRIVYCELFKGNDRWQEFVFSWFRNPRRVWEYLGEGA